MKKIISLLLAVVFAGVAMAQHSQEVSVNGGAGLSSLLFSQGNSDQDMGGGGKVGVGYSYFFNSNWGINTGVDFGFYNATSKLARDIYTQQAVDGFDGSNFAFKATYTGYKEKASAVLLTIPVMAQYQMEGDRAFYVAFGGKIGFPISAKYKASGHLLTEGDYGSGFSYSGDLPERGFVDSHSETTKDLDFKPSFMLAVELGAKWYLTDEFSLYTGAYIDYGLTNMNNTNTKGTLVAYQSENPSEFKRESLVGSSDRITSLAVGVTVRLSFGLR